MAKSAAWYDSGSRPAYQASEYRTCLDNGKPMLDKLFTKKIDLNAEFDLKLQYQRAKHYGSYQANVSEGLLGGIVGGGSRTFSWGSDAFTIHVTNRGQDMRSYSFLVVVFKSLRRKIVVRQEIATISNVKPGYTAHAQVELRDGEWLSRTVIEEIWATSNKQRVLHLEPHLRVHHHARKWLYFLGYPVVAFVAFLALRLAAHLYFG